VPGLVAALDSRYWREDGLYLHEEAARRLVPFGRLAVPAVVKALEDSSRRRLSVEVLTQIGADAAPALSRCLLHESADVRMAAARILADVAPQTLVGSGRGQSLQGIERTDRAYDMKVELTDFFRIGASCLAQYDGVFSFRAMARVLDTSVPVLRERLDAVTEFFRGYFEQYGHPPERVPFAAAFDNDELAAEEDRIIERSERRRPRICEPVGRWAWELTRDFLHQIHAIPEDDGERS
jgi:hypothetical protein